MKILHLAAGNRWTGAAAPAFAEVEALRAAGIDAHYAYVGGYRLEAKIGHHDFTHAAIRKWQNPIAFKLSIDALDRLLTTHRFDVVHAHLTYDHWLARMAARNRDVRVARTFHSRRVLRSDLFTRSLINNTQHLFIINEAFADAAALNGRPAVFTPPPLDHRQFSPEGANVRAQYGIASHTRLITAIGKLAPDRGFEAVLSTFAVLRRSRSDVRMMIIGHGEHRPALEAHASRLGITNDLIWAGYHEDDLAEHYRAANLLLFTARGSDEGHRAVLEAMACGIPVASYPVEGVSALIGRDRVASSATPEALALIASEALANPTDVYARSLAFGYDKAAERLIAGYK
ncbi:MAG TPA: glycosyltransferase family 4 protein [Thermoanaerobaculia bacterium]|jgi:glycosyltransferase involved in cell wall biosynthesis